MCGQSGIIHTSLAFILKLSFFLKKKAFFISFVALKLKVTKSIQSQLSEGGQLASCLQCTGWKSRAHYVSPNGLRGKMWEGGEGGLAKGASDYTMLQNPS